MKRVLQPDNNSVKNRKIYLDAARVFAIISISLNHAVNRAYDNYEDQYSEFWSFSRMSSMIKAIVSVFSRIGVPLFLMITGVLILNKTFENSKDVKRFYKNNLLRLFITAEIWFFLMYWVSVFCNPEVTMIQEYGFFSAVRRMIRTMFFFDQITMGSMWYIPMILSLYLILPFCAFLIKRFDKELLAIPLVMIFFYEMVLKSINGFRLINGKEVWKVAFCETELPYMYLLYIIIGYWIGNGGLAKLKNWMLVAITVSTFACCCAYQYYAYSKPENYLVSYFSPGILLITTMIFALIKRKEHCFVRFKSILGYLSRISFAIYFVHIVIMELIDWNINFEDLPHSVTLLILEVVSVLGSIIIISILSKIKVCKKYLFMIKD